MKVYLHNLPKKVLRTIGIERQIRDTTCWSSPKGKILSFFSVIYICINFLSTALVIWRKEVSEGRPSLHRKSKPGWFRAVCSFGRSVEKILLSGSGVRESIRFQTSIIVASRSMFLRRTQAWWGSTHTTPLREICAQTLRNIVEINLMSSSKARTTSRLKTREKLVFDRYISVVNEKPSGKKKCERISVSCKKTETAESRSDHTFLTFIFYPEYKLGFQNIKTMVSEMCGLKVVSPLSSIFFVPLPISSIKFVSFIWIVHNHLRSITRCFSLKRQFIYRKLKYRSVKVLDRCCHETNLSPLRRKFSVQFRDFVFCNGFCYLVYVTATVCFIVPNDTILVSLFAYCSRCGPVLLLIFALHINVCNGSFHGYNKRVIPTLNFYFMSSISLHICLYCYLSPHSWTNVFEYLLIFFSENLSTYWAPWVSQLPFAFLASTSVSKLLTRCSLLLLVQNSAINSLLRLQTCLQPYICFLGVSSSHHRFLQYALASFPNPRTPLRASESARFLKQVKGLKCE